MGAQLWNNRQFAQETVLRKKSVLYCPSQKIEKCSFEDVDVAWPHPADVGRTVLIRLLRNWGVKMK